MQEKIKEEFQMSEAFLTAVFIILSGGFQDAYTYCCRGGVFANAQTGNIVLLSTGLFKGEIKSSLKYLVPIVSFLIGIAVAEIVKINLKAAKSLHWRQTVLLFEMILLFAVGFIPHRLDLIANALVSFVCAMQIQTFPKVRGHAYASTMCIGNMRNAVESLVIYSKTKEIHILKKSLIYFAVILIFALGAGIGCQVTLALGKKAIYICCLLLFISFNMMFIKKG